MTGMYPATPGTRQAQSLACENLLTRAEWGRQRATAALPCQDSTGHLLPGQGALWGSRTIRFSFLFAWEACLSPFWPFQYTSKWFHVGLVQEATAQKSLEIKQQQQMKLRRQYLTLWRWLQVKAGGLWRKWHKSHPPGSSQTLQPACSCSHHCASHRPPYQALMTSRKTKTSLFFFFEICILCVYTSALPTCICVYYMCAQCPQMPEEAISFSETSVIGYFAVSREVNQEFLTMEFYLKHWLQSYVAQAGFEPDM